MLFLRGGKGGASVSSLGPISGMSRTFINTSGAASPAATPIHELEMHFREGDVPTGYIAVPQIGGVDVAYQADRVVRWDTDGSLKSAYFPIAHTAAITAGGTVQVTFDRRTGSYTNTSAITTSSITGASDYRVALSNVHSAKVGSFPTGGNPPTGNGYPNERMLTVAISGGQVSSIKSWYRDTNAISSYKITGGGGSNGFITVAANGTVTIDNAGSGYVNIGSGSFNIGFNDIVTAVNSGGNHANGVALIQTHKGPVLDAWMAYGLISGLPHAFIIFYVERWKKADGTFLSLRALAEVCNGTVDTVNTITNYTFDLDWKNGATVIRGASTGDTRLQTVMMMVGASGKTLDAQAMADWSVSSSSFNAIIPQWTLAECDYYRGTTAQGNVGLPLMKIAPTQPVPSVPNSFETNSADGGWDNVGTYQPFIGTAGIRCPLGGGGSGNSIQLRGLGNMVLMSWRAGLTSAARIWLNNLRVTAAHAANFAQLGGPFVEPTTMWPPNGVPASAQTFTGMTPARDTIYIANVISTGYANPLIASSGGTITDLTNSAGSTYHHLSLAFDAFCLLGHQWMLNTVMYASTTPLFAANHSSKRKATFNGRTYHNIYCNQVANVRVVAWRLRAHQQAACALPATFADGSVNPVRDLILYSIKEQYDYLNDLPPFIGTVTMGSTNYTKSIDLTDTGVDPENFSPSNANGFGGSVSFMDAYMIVSQAEGAHLLRGTDAGTAALAQLTYRLKSYAKRRASPAPQQYTDSYRLMEYATPEYLALADPTWQKGFNPADPGLGVHPFCVAPPSAAPAAMMFTVGSSTITAWNWATGSVATNGIKFDETTRIASGSRIKLTTAFVANTTPNYTTLPGGFNLSTWYYWKELTPSTGQLCTDAAMLNPVTPTTNPSSVDHDVFFWMVPANTILANSVGHAYRTTSPNAESDNASSLGALRAIKFWHGDLTGYETAAIANLDALLTAMGVDYAARPTFAYATT